MEEPQQMLKAERKLVPELKAQARLRSEGAISHPKENTGRRTEMRNFLIK